MADDFVHLHNHFDTSKLDGHMKPIEGLRVAKELGQPAMAINDHGYCVGHMDFYQAAKTVDIKPIMGVEAYVAPSGPDGEPSDLRHHKPVFWRQARQQDADEQAEGKDVAGAGKYTHQTLIAENTEGLRNLWRITSTASKDGFYGNPRADHALIAAHAKGVIATTGCPSGEVQTRLRLGQIKLAEAAVARDLDIFGRDRYFMEVMDHGIAVEKQVKQALLDLGKRMGLRPLATNDAHYATAQDAAAHDALLACNSGRNLDDPKRFKFDGNGYYLKSGAEMRAIFDDTVPGACDNTLLVAEMVAPDAYDEAFAWKNRMPKFPVPDGKTAKEYLREVVFEDMRALSPGGMIAQEDIDQINYELSVMCPDDPVKVDWSDYFLWIRALCRWMKSVGIPYGPRGSAAGSTVNYALGVAALHPRRFGLLFERFMNPDRVSPPDIDIDVRDDRRAEVYAWLREQIGEEYTANIIAFQPFRGKGSIEASARIQGINISKKNELTRIYPEPLFGKPMMLREIYDPQHPRTLNGDGAQLRELVENDPTAAKIVDTAKLIEGRIRSYGRHPCGLCASGEKLHGIIPLVTDKESGTKAIGFEFDGKAESMGLFKMDILGLRNLREIDDAVRWVKQLHGVDIDLDDQAFDDPLVYRALSRGDTSTLFQLEGSGMRDLLRRMRPTVFGDVVATQALYRPGPMGMNSHNLYADRKNGREPIEPIHPELASLSADQLAETYGLICYQEDVMNSLRAVAGFTRGEADLVRKAMGKKKRAELDKARSKVESGMAERGYSAEAAQALWATLESFADYAFPKAHAACYARVAYWTCWLKVHYPVEWMAAVLSAEGGDKEKLAVYLAEAKRMGIEVLVPDINESGAEFTPTLDGKIRFGLGVIASVPEKAVAAVIAGRRTGPYRDFVDFMQRVPAAACTAAALTGFAQGGAFDGIEPNRNAVVVAAAAAAAAARDAKKIAATGQMDLFAPPITADSTAEDLEHVVLTGLRIDPQIRPYERLHQLELERSRLGLYVSGHPLDGLEATLAAHRDETTAELIGSQRVDGETRLCGQIMNVETRARKADGKLWATITLEDLDGSAEVHVYSRAYPALAEELVVGRLVSVKARVFGDVRTGDDGEEPSVEQKISAIYIDQVEIIDPDAPVIVYLRPDKVTEQVVAGLQRACRTHPGGQALRFRLVGADGVARWETSEQRVAMASPFISEVKGLVGRGAFTWAPTP